MVGLVPPPPKMPLKSTACAALAFSGGTTCAVTAAAAIPRPTPSSAPIAPSAADSPSTSPITRRRDHPNARSVPSSRVRLATDASIRSAAMPTAAAGPR